MFPLQIQELLHYLRVEKSSRKDLEMYVAVLTTQKNIFEEECDKTKKDLEEGNIGEGHKMGRGMCMEE